MATRSQSQSQIPSGSTAPGSWLNTIFNYALGRQTEVFALVKYPSKRGLTYIGLQPRACPFVFRLVSKMLGLNIYLFFSFIFSLEFNIHFYF